MKVSYICFVLLIFSGCASNNLQNQEPKTVTIYIDKNKCELIEGGSGYKTNYVKFEGKLWEKNDQHYECAVEIPENEFKNMLGSLCILSGFNSASSYFYTGENSLLRKQSCTFRQLRKGTFYFNAGGISSDSCSWTCF